ncbi:MAG: hypothetical protein WCK05_12960 [Planctomycetota bacterium]
MTVAVLSVHQLLAPAPPVAQQLQFLTGARMERMRDAHKTHPCVCQTCIRS